MENLGKSGQKSESVYCAKSGYVMRDVAGDSLIIPVMVNDGIGEKVGIVNEAGKLLWEKLQNEQTFSDLVQAVVDEFDVSEETAKQDILEFLQQLRQYGFLEETEEERG